MDQIDIIVPVYNAHDYTKKCIETVIKNSDLLNHKLILINDKSTDNRILPMLNEFKIRNNNLNIVVINNELNNGFVKTVNIGLNYSKNDVIILNSDTEVTENWLNKLSDCAYSEPMVATVTPLSNNATLASVPNFLEDNKLPEHIELEEYSKIIENISFKGFPEIPTGNGFCMYITRYAIDTVGLFDDVTFEKGYGEENDFCYRCIEHGFKNLLCDNTFIYHKGTQSFSTEKEEFINSHLKILKDKYPLCYANTDNYCKDNPYKYIQRNIQYEINSINRKNILFIVHDFRKLSEKNLGGTTLHIYDIINGLRNEFNFHVLYPNENQYYITSFFKDSMATIEFSGIHEYNILKLYNNEYKKIIKDVTSILKIDLIHVHHMKYHYLDIFTVAKESEIPVVFTLHDFYSICPTIQLLDQNDKYCKYVEKKYCAKCLKKRLNINSNMINTWQKEFSKVLNNVDKVIVPSENTKEEILDTYKNLSIDVIEHGVNRENDVYEPKNDNDKFNVAFLGGISEHKGINILKELVKKANNTDINIHLFGTTNDKNYNKSINNYIYHGIYKREDIRRLLIENNIKLVCLFSIWPETYSYTLTESLISNIPVITFDIGAIADRIRAIDGGYIIDYNSTPDEIYEEILRIKENKDDYNTKLKNINEAIKKIKTLEQMNNEYYTLYKSLIKIKVEYSTSELSKKTFFSSKEKSSKILKDELKIKEDVIYTLRNELEIKEESILEYDKCLRIVNNRYNSIINSKRWKCLGGVKMPKIFSKIPFKKGDV